jgi:hypothetical protein
MDMRYCSNSQQSDSVGLLPTKTPTIVLLTIGRGALGSLAKISRGASSVSISLLMVEARLPQFASEPSTPQGL